MSKQWPKVKLGEVLRRVERFEPREEFTEYPFAGTYSFARGIFVGERKLGSKFALPKIQRIRAGDFIYCKIMAWEGAFGIAPKETDNCVMSGAFVVYELNRERIDEKFLDYFFKVPEHWQSIGSQSTGTNVRRQSLHPSQFEKAEIPFPPIVEQRRIIARIDELASHINEARALRQETVVHAEALQASKICALFTEGSAAGWTKGRLDDYVVDDCYGTSEKTCDDDTGTPILAMGNIQKGQIDTRKLKYLHLSEKDRRRLLLQRGDILVNRTNSAELVGKCAVFDEERDFAFASYLIRLRLDTDKADPHLVASYINSPAGRAYMFSERKQMTGQANVNATKLKALPIALPQLPEQRRIVAELDALQAEVDKLKCLQAETAAELDALLPSILDRAFKGEL